MHSRDNACDGGISLSGRSEVSLTATTSCRLQLFCVTGAQIAGNVATAVREWREYWPDGSMRTGDPATGHLDLGVFCALLRFWSKCRVGTQNSLYTACFKCIPRNVSFKRQYRPCSTSSFYCIILRTSSPSFASVLSPLQFTFTSVRKEACLRAVKSCKFWTSLSVSP